MNGRRRTVGSQSSRIRTMSPQIKPKMRSTASNIFFVLICCLLCRQPTQSSAQNYDIDDSGSGCSSDIQDSADLCLEGSGGSGDDSIELVETTVPSSLPIKTVCRNTRLITWIPDSVEKSDAKSYQMVQSCPKLDSAATGEDRGTSIRCEAEHHDIYADEMSLLLPVTSLSTNVTYYNRYCFLCAEEDPGPEATWSINVSCSQWVELFSLADERSVLRTALESGHCTLALQPPVAASTLAERCHTLPSSLTTINRKGSPLSLLLQFWTKSDDTYSEGSGDTERGGTTFNRGCLRLYHFGRTQCAVLHCSPGRRLQDDFITCEPVVKQSRGQYYSLTLTMQIYVDRDDVGGELTSGSMSSLCSPEELIKAGIKQHTGYLHTEAYNLTGWVSSGRTEAQTSVDVQYENVDVDSDDLYFETLDDVSSGEVEKELLLAEVLIWFDFIVTSDAERNQVERSALHMSREDWHVVCGNTHARLVPKIRSRMDYDKNKGRPTNATQSEVFVETLIHADYREFWAWHEFAPVTISPALFCPFVIFSRDEYFIGNSVGGDEDRVNLTLLDVVAFVSSSAINIDETGNLKICIRILEEHFRELLRAAEDSPEELSDWVKLEHYVSLACVCLSLFCLFITLVTYAMFRSLRTAPGQNLMALCCNLFLAQALLQFGVNRRELKAGCVALGMLIHYFWLASVLWMNVCSFHMHRVFTARRATRMTSTRVKCCTRRIAAYTVYAQGVPVVAVGATAAASILLSDGNQVGYGDKNICYLSSPLLVGVAFAIPLGVVLLLNLIFFLRSVREIARTEKLPIQNGSGGGSSAHNGLRSPSPVLSHLPPYPVTWRRNLNVCIRLSSLTGLFWTLGLASELLQPQIMFLRLLSVIVNGLQGVLIAVSYLPNRRVARLYSRACCTCRGHSRQMAAISSPQGTAPSAATSLTSSALTGSTQNVTVTGMVAREGAETATPGGMTANGHLNTSEI